MENNTIQGKLYYREYMYAAESLAKPFEGSVTVLLFSSQLNFLLYSLQIPCLIFSHLDVLRTKAEIAPYQITTLTFEGR